MYSKPKIIVGIILLFTILVTLCIKVKSDIYEPARVTRVIENVDIHGNRSPGTIATKRCEIELNRFSCIMMTDSEYELLASVIYDLAGGKSEREQRRICEIVFNRVLSDEFPNSVEAVITDMSPCPQFDTTDGTAYDYQRGIIDYVLTVEPLTDSNYYFY